LASVLDDHHGARGVVGDAVRSGTQQVVLEQVPLVADDHEVEAALVRVANDQVSRMPGTDVDFELDLFLPRLLPCQSSKRLEEHVLLPLHLVDLADRGRIRR